MPCLMPCRSARRTRTLLRVRGRRSCGNRACGMEHQYAVLHRVIDHTKRNRHTGDTLFSRLRYMLRYSVRMSNMCVRMYAFRPLSAARSAAPLPGGFPHPTRDARGADRRRLRSCPRSPRTTHTTVTTTCHCHTTQAEHKRDSRSHTISHTYTVSHILHLSLYFRVARASHRVHLS